jgi:hypothetical protein
MENLKYKNKCLFELWSTEVKHDLHSTDFDEAHKYLTA